MFRQIVAQERAPAGGFASGSFDNVSTTTPISHVHSSRPRKSADLHPAESAGTPERGFSLGPRARFPLAFFSPEKLVSFSLRQSASDLVFQRQNQNRQGRVSEVHIDADDVLRQGTAAFITLTASAQGTAIYVDGALAKSSSHFGLSSRDFAGQLVVGSSPVANESWTGDLRGLAIYDRELTSMEVIEHFSS